MDGLELSGQNVVCQSFCQFLGATQRDRGLVVKESGPPQRLAHKERNKCHQQQTDDSHPELPARSSYAPEQVANLRSAFARSGPRDTRTNKRILECRASRAQRFVPGDMASALQQRRPQTVRLPLFDPRGKVSSGSVGPRLREDGSDGRSPRRPYDSVSSWNRRRVAVWRSGFFMWPSDADA
jgi:hypothetical protein